MSTEEKVFKIAPFTDKSVWRVWSQQFLAQGSRSGYQDIVLGKVSVPADSVVIDTTTQAGKELEKVFKLNTNAYSDLIMSFADIVNFGLVEAARTKDLPNGDAALAWKKLSRKHEPTTTANKVKLMGDYANSKLKTSKDDPDVWITELELLQAKLMRMNHVITDEDMIVHIINNLPK
jgi:gag-polypeptide of LTR copia-type